MNKKVLEKVIDGKVEERKFLCEHSFGAFALYYFTQYFKYKLAPYHYEFFKDAEDLVKGEIKEAGWIAFRESGKTSVAKIFIIWLIVYKKRKYINVDSYDKENAERILFDVAFELTNNKKLFTDFPLLFSKKKSVEDVKQNRINNFVTENGIRVEAHSTQESVRGRLHLNQRPDAMILDDIETNKTKDSKAYTKQVRDHLTEAMGGLATNSLMLYLGNYITEYGNIQWLFDRAKENKTIRMRNIAIFDESGLAWQDKYVMTDLEAERTGKVSIEYLNKKLGSYVFSYEMLNKPVDEALAEFKKDCIQRAELSEVKHLSTNTFITLDPAVSENSSADFTGVTINRVSSENNWYITSYKLKMNSKDIIDHLFYLWVTYKPLYIGIEKEKFLLAIKPFLEDEMRKRNTFINIKELSHKGTAKDTRIRGIIPRWESKSIFLVGDCKDLEEEMRTFPRGLHDDVLDSLAYQNDIAFAPERPTVDEYQAYRKPGNNPAL